MDKRFENKGFTDEEIKFFKGISENEIYDLPITVSSFYQFRFNASLSANQLLARYQDYLDVLNGRDEEVRKAKLRERNAENITKELIDIFIKQQMPNANLFDKITIFNYIWKWEKWTKEKFMNILKDIQNEVPPEELSSDIDDNDDADDGLDPMDGFQKEKELQVARAVSDFQKMAEDLLKMNK